MRNALSGVERAMFWTLAAAAFAAAAAGLAARATDRLAEGYDQARRNYAIVRVLAPEGPEAIAAAETALADAPHVASAARITAGRAAALLGLANAEDAPPLRLIEVELNPAPDSADVSGDIVAALAQGGVTAEMVEAPDVESGGQIASWVRSAAFWGACAFGLVMAAIVWLAARALAARGREMVTVLTDLGATEAQTVGRIADEAALMGLYAGLAGAAFAAAAGVVAILLMAPGANLETLPAMIRPLDLAPLAAAPIGAAVAAGLGARAAAGYFHARAARLG